MIVRGYIFGHELRFLLIRMISNYIKREGNLICNCNLSIWMNYSSSLKLSLIKIFIFIRIIKNNNSSVTTNTIWIHYKILWINIYILLRRSK